MWSIKHHHTTHEERIRLQYEGPPSTDLDSQTDNFDGGLSPVSTLPNTATSNVEEECLRPRRTKKLPGYYAEIGQEDETQAMVAYVTGATRAAWHVKIQQETTLTPAEAMDETLMALPPTFGTMPPATATTAWGISSSGLRQRCDERQRKQKQRREEETNSVAPVLQNILSILQPEGQSILALRQQFMTNSQPIFTLSIPAVTSMYDQCCGDGLCLPRALKLTEQRDNNEQLRDPNICNPEGREELWLWMKQKLEDMTQEPVPKQVTGARIEQLLPAATRIHQMMDWLRKRPLEHFYAVVGLPLAVLWDTLLRPNFIGHADAHYFLLPVIDHTETVKRMIEDVLEQRQALGLPPMGYLGAVSAPTSRGEATDCVSLDLSTIPHTPVAPLPVRNAFHVLFTRNPAATTTSVYTDNQQSCGEAVDPPLSTDMAEARPPGHNQQSMTVEVNPALSTVTAPVRNAYDLLCAPNRPQPPIQAATAKRKRSKETGEAAGTKLDISPTPGHKRKCQGQEPDDICEPLSDDAMEIENAGNVDSVSKSS
eukprot:gene8112-biopygen3908